MQTSLDAPQAFAEHGPVYCAVEAETNMNTEMTLKICILRNRFNKQVEFEVKAEREMVEDELL